MFFGTPHNGAEKAGFLNLLLNANFSKKDYVKDLPPNSQLLNDINNTFGGTVSEGLSRLVSYRETTGVVGIGVMCPLRSLSLR